MSDNPADRVERVATFADLPAKGDSVTAYYVEELDEFYYWHTDGYH